MAAPRIIDRYALFDEIAAGGMGVVHVGRLVGSQGFARIVAIKRLHPNLAKDPDFVEMFVDEARLAARIRHPNVVITLDVVEGDGEVLVVMDYVHGATLSKMYRMLRDRGELVPRDIAAGIMHGALQGLHAAHEAKTEHGASLGIVHRDVSPQNIMVGADGVPRVLDFGVAKAAWRAVTTREGEVKGKLAYMAPEQVNGQAIDRRVDVYAAGIVFWEMLAGRRLFQGDNPGQLTHAVLRGAQMAPSQVAADVPPALDAIVMKALAVDPDARYQSALEMVVDLERAVPIATGRRIGEWLTEIAKDSLDHRARYVADVESKESLSDPQIQIAVDGEQKTQLVPLVPLAPPSREPGSVTQAIVTAETMSAAAMKARSPWKPAAIGAGAAATVAFAAFLVLSVRASREGHENTALAASAPPPPLAASAPLLDPAPATPSTVAANASAAVTETKAAAAAPTQAPKPVAKPAVVKTSAPAAATCEPPYTIDAKGVRVPKRECF